MVILLDTFFLMRGGRGLMGHFFGKMDQFESKWPLLVPSRALAQYFLVCQSLPGILPCFFHIKTLFWCIFSFNLIIQFDTNNSLKNWENFPSSLCPPFSFSCPHPSPFPTHSHLSTTSFPHPIHVIPIAPNITTKNSPFLSQAPLHLCQFIPRHNHHFKSHRILRYQTIAFVKNQLWSNNRILTTFTYLFFQSIPHTHSQSHHTTISKLVPGFQFSNYGSKYQ